MEQKHTPGPWYEANNANKSQGLVISEVDGANIAVTYDKANARLISAAPEMLAALEELVAEFDAVNADRDPARDGLYPDTGGIAYARTIIKKAKGE